MLQCGLVLLNGNRTIHCPLKSVLNETKLVLSGKCDLTHGTTQLRSSRDSLTVFKLVECIVIVRVVSELVDHMQVCVKSRFP
jgi:hypothetical protein